MSYWNEKDGRLTFKTQVKIKFLPLNNSSKKCLEKSLNTWGATKKGDILLLKNGILLQVTDLLSEKNVNYKLFSDF